MNPNDAFDSTTQYLGDLDARRASYAVATGVILSAAFVYVLNRSGFRAMVAIGRG